MFIQDKSSIKSIRGNHFSINSLEENGFYILENGFAKEDLELLSNFRNFFIEESEIQKKNISNLRGYELGNLNIDKCFIHRDIWKLMMKSETIKEIFNNLKINKIQDIRSVGGNMNLPHSIPQAFHRDSSLRSKYLLIFIALEKITSENGAQEVISDSNVKGKNFIDMLIARLKYGSILANMNPGDILFRYSSTWHRGTKNSSFLPRVIPMFSINLDNRKSVNITNIKISQFDKKISFKGNYAPDGKSRKLYTFLALKFNRFFHLLIYFTKLFKSE